MTGSAANPVRRSRQRSRRTGPLFGATAVCAALLLTFNPPLPATIGVAAGTGPAPLPKPTWVDPPDQSVPVAAPVRVRIPAIGVDSAIIEIGVNPAGVLVPPGTADIVGWFAAGPAPGDLGPALLAAHVDSRAGPGVFYDLVDLRPGDEITVDRADGSTSTFTVRSATQVPKIAFPTELVYAPLPIPMLRLITCGGSFDRAARSYRDNIIVEAAEMS